MDNYSQFKKRIKYTSAYVIPALRKAGYEDLAQRIDDCGKIIRVATCSDCGTQHFAGNASRCMSRFCPSCSRMRSKAWCARLLPFLQEWFSSGNYAFNLNFTIADTQSLSTGLSVLKRAWRYMVHDDKQSRKIFNSLFKGGFRSIEVKTGEGSGLWHPHMHCIVLKDKFSRDFVTIRDLWDKAVKAVGGVPGKNEKYGSIDARGFTQKSLLKNVLEVAKYITKMNWESESSERVAELIDNTRNLRNVQCWGVLYRLPKEVEEELKTADERVLNHKICKACYCSELTLEKTWYQVEMDLEDLVDSSDVDSSLIHTVPKPEKYEQLVMPLSRYGSWLGDEE